MITKPNAEEFSQTVEQIGEGWVRQLALGIKMGVPEALGVTRRQWSDRIGVTMRNAAERRGAVIELSAEGLSNRAIADVLGVDEGTVRNDRRAENSAPKPSAPKVEEDHAAENSAPLILYNPESPAVKALPERRKREFNAALHELCCCMAFLEWFQGQPHDDEVDTWGALFEISKRYKLVVVTHCTLFPKIAWLKDALKKAEALYVGMARELREVEQLARKRAP